MPEAISVYANGRELKITGNVEVYLSWHSGYNADNSSIFQAAQNIPSGSTILDVGANIGIVATTFAVQRPDCKVIAIEPVPSNFECLRRNIEANKISNIEAVNAAASDSYGTVKMNDNGPWSAVLNDAPLTIDAIQIDRYIDRDVSFVKIDTEGFEPNVFAGARSLFETRKPLIHVEFNTLLLLAHEYDPVAFAFGIWNSFEILGMYHGDKFALSPVSPFDMVQKNIVEHGSVTDFLLRPKAPLPELMDLCYSNVTRNALKEVDRLNQDVDPPADRRVSRS